MPSSKKLLFIIGAIVLLGILIFTSMDQANKQRYIDSDYTEVLDTFILKAEINEPQPLTEPSTPVARPDTKPTPAAGPR